MSKPIRLRGLKCLSFRYFYQACIVEAYTASWIEIIHHGTINRANLVEAYTASWIEIPQKKVVKGTVKTVEAYTASWIEMKHLEM